MHNAQVQGRAGSLARPVGTESYTEVLSCPFCKEHDFDLIGLQMHLQNGWCDVFGKVEHDATP